MSFLIRRNLPKAWAGWFDGFERDPENPIQKPWVHLGDGSPAVINSNGEMHIPANASTSNGGGESYEFEPFTPNWGFEMEIRWPSEGLLAQYFGMFFTDSWAKIGPNKFQNCIGVRLLHQGILGSKVNYGEWASMMSIGGNVHTWDSPVGFFGNTLTLRVLCENDEWVRIWLNGYYVGSMNITPAYRTGHTRRCIRFVNAALCDAWIRWIDHYDRPPSVPPKTVWTSILSDDFERADGAVGNGWTQYGTDAGLVSGNWTHTGTNENNVGLLRDSGISSGRIRIEATVNTTTAIGSGLLLCCNSAGDQSLIASFQSGHVWLSRMTSSVNGAPTYSHFQDGDVTVTAGDKVAFSVYNDICWFEVNGVPKLYAGNANGIVPETNQYAGLRVQRTSNGDSTAFRDVQIFSGVGI